MSSQKICIAGKNNIAIEGMKIAMRKIPVNNLFFICDINDNGKDCYFPSYKRFCEDKKIKELSINEAQSIEDIVFISLEYFEIIKPSLFSSKNLFNLHFSLLPSYRGMYTSCHPILRGERYSGVTLHRIDSGIDTGDIIDQVRFELNARETAETLYKKYNLYGTKLLAKNFDKLVSLKFDSRKQPIRGSSYFSKKSIDFSSLEIDHFKSAFEVDCQYRAYTFRYFQLPTFKGAPISSSHILNDRSSLKPGSVIWRTETQICISTTDYNVLLEIDL